MFRKLNFFDKRETEAVFAQIAIDRVSKAGQRVRFIILAIYFLLFPKGKDRGNYQVHYRRDVR